MLLNCLFVGCGGFLGSVFRYLLSLLKFEGVLFPVITLGINAVGSFAIMFIANYLGVVFNLDERWLLFLRVGLCGGFTTFSTFSMEVVNLAERGEIPTAIIYATLSCVVCIGAAFFGGWLSNYLQMR